MAEGLPIAGQDLTGTYFLGPNTVNAASVEAAKRGGQAKEVLAEWAQAGRFAAEAGLTVEAQPRKINTSQYDNPEWNGDLTFSFTRITSPQHVLVREHLQSLRPLLRPRYTQHVITGALHFLMDGLDSSRLFDIYRDDIQVREPHPIHGIKILKRSELGMPPRTAHAGDRTGQALARYAVVAGSIPDAVAWRFPSHDNEPTRREEALKEMSAMLLDQFAK